MKGVWKKTLVSIEGVEWVLGEKRGEEIFAELIVVLFGQQINVFFFKGLVGICCGVGQ